MSCRNGSFYLVQRDDTIVDPSDAAASQLLAQKMGDPLQCRPSMAPDRSRTMFASITAALHSASPRAQALDGAALFDPRFLSKVEGWEAMDISRAAAQAEQEATDLEKTPLLTALIRQPVQSDSHC
jgi:hypothetical protein